ncbi:hypothetical protein D9M71_794390 [compost metagenome]
MSSGCAIRPSGDSPEDRYDGGVLPCSREDIIGVSTVPGATALTTMPDDASSTARTPVNACTAAFVAE